ncbi:MAG: hypothetical protein PVF34_06645 [Gammaproteobacteria bacterium]|jgi:hypothetical protein
MSVEKLLTSIQLVLLPGVLLIILLAVAFHAEAGTEDKPSMELLEFLGEWQTKEGEWVDPMRFMNIDEKDLKQGSDSTVNVNEDIRND